MKTPALLLGAALMFWGWQTGLWLLALPMALIFEASHLIRLRWDLAAKDFRRITDVCTILLIISVVYLWVSDRNAPFIFALTQWLPIVFFPLLVAQVYSTSDRINMRVLFLLRRQTQKNKNAKRTLLNLTYPYFAVCIVSAAAANIRDSSFYVGLFVLVALAMWMVRSKRFSPVLWICLLVIAGGGGVLGHIGLHRLQLILEAKGLEWTSDFRRHDPDPFRTHTAIGDIGSLKPSERIIFRVTPGGPAATPMLLRETTYNRYLSPIWVAVTPDFAPVRPDAGTTTWHFYQGPADGRAITVAAKLHKGQGVLKLPDGAFRVDNLPLATMERNRYGTVKVDGGPGFVTYRIQFDKRMADHSPPAEYDLNIADKEKPAIELIRDQLKLTGKPPRKILERVESFFQKNFAYSLAPTGGRYKNTPLANFLLQSRAGHCEYFATATVLLLRSAGIPARYARGYSVHEFSRLENRFIVRDRHAHAWTLVYIDGAWRNFDTTPGSWISIEDAAAPGWVFITDLGSWCRFNLSKGFLWIRQRGGFEYLGWLLIAVVFLLVRRLFRKKRIRRPVTKKRSEAAADRKPAGSDSDFYLIEDALIRAGFARDPAETLRNWITRLPQDQPAAHLMGELKSILQLHYRYRFDPRGISAAEKAALTSGTRVWLDAYHRLMHSAQPEREYSQIIKFFQKVADIIFRNYLKEVD
ncbi:MAG: transglutaminase domain-containing protein [Desulfobacterales bacterium]|nr:MAG: transglutaminase domain-containing protein [Desulfobacterales bacterium]